MSYNDEGDIMSAFFSGKININNIKNLESKMVEIGHGVGIGHKDGSYTQYIKKLSERKNEGNGIIYLGKAINTDTDKLSIIDNTDKFATEDIPKLLIRYNNLINKTFIKVTWKNDNNDTILEQYYDIPAPQTMQYAWWDTYSIYFIGPEDLEEGEYKVEIMSTDITNMSNKQTVSTSTMNFTIIDKNQIIRIR